MEINSCGLVLYKHCFILWARSLLSRYTEGLTMATDKTEVAEDTLNRRNKENCVSFKCPKIRADAEESMI